jgi:DNA-binding transcriptional ArsR family regulator
MRDVEPFGEAERFSYEAIRVFKALADRTRYEIVRRLAQADEICAAQLAEAFVLSGPALSHHYRVLESCGLIYGRKVGLHTFYRLNRPQLARYVPEFERVHVRDRWVEPVGVGGLSPAPEGAVGAPPRRAKLSGRGGVYPEGRIRARLGSPGQPN